MSKARSCFQPLESAHLSHTLFGLELTQPALPCTQASDVSQGQAGRRPVDQPAAVGEGSAQAGAVGRDAQPGALIGRHGLTTILTRDVQPALIGRHGLTTILGVPVPAVLHNAVVLYRRTNTLS